MNRGVELAVVLLAVLAAGFVQGALGFGFGIVAMSVIPLVMGVKDAVLVVAIFAICMNGGLLWHLRKHVDRRVLPLAVAVPIGAPIGIGLLLNTDPRYLMLALAVLVFGFVFREFRGAAKQEDRPPPGAAWGVAAGLFGSILGAAFNVGGPPAIMYGSACRWPPLVFKACLQAFFMLQAVLQIGMLTYEGEFTRDHLTTSAAGAPALALGALLGLRASSRIDHEHFRKVVLGALFLLAIGLVARALG